MKLIARKDFARVGSLEDHVDTDGLKHDRHIHKGARFEIGSAEKFEELKKAEQQLIATLNLAGCIADATDDKAVKSIEREIAIDKKREETAARLDARSDAAELMKQLTGLVGKAATQAEKAKT